MLGRIFPVIGFSFYTSLESLEIKGGRRRVLIIGTDDRIRRISHDSCLMALMPWHYGGDLEHVVGQDGTLKELALAMKKGTATVEEKIDVKYGRRFCALGLKCIRRV